MVSPLHTGPAYLLSLVVPFYNEEEGIDTFFVQVEAALNAISGSTYEVLCVNDGSKDLTLYNLLRHSARNARVKVIDLSRNFGKEAALTTGIDIAAGDAVIPFDADLQDPPEVIAQVGREMARGLRRRDCETPRPQFRQLCQASVGILVLPAP